jgi:hypothetical protein
MTDLTDDELLVELRAKRDWWRTNPSGMTAALHASERFQDSGGDGL